LFVCLFVCLREMFIFKWWKRLDNVNREKLK
jgi:hypothetical protein